MNELIERKVAGATIWDWLTDITGSIAIVMLLLLIYGFRGYIRHPRTAAIDFLGTGIWLLSLLLLLRMAWWDLLPGLLGVNWRDDYGISASHVNWIFNSIVCVGVWYKLHGYWKLVEARAPGRYNTFTAVFYPSRAMWMGNKRESEHE